MKSVKKYTPGTKIEFNYRKELNNHTVNVLEDFFSFFHYDILIRPASNFSIVAGFLHDYALLAAPEKFTMHDGPNGKVVTMDKLEMQMNKELFSKLLNRCS